MRRPLAESGIVAFDHHPVGERDRFGLPPDVVRGAGRSPEAMAGVAVGQAPAT